MSDQVLDYDNSYLIYGGGTSFVIYFVLFRFVSPFISRRITSSYKDLPNYEQQEWNDRFISNINAVISVIFSAYVLLLEPETRTDRIWFDSPTARTACAIIIGYMIADLLCMFIWCKTTKGEMFGYIVHHAATVYAYFYVVVYGILCYLAMFRLIAEASTVPVNQRWFFDVSKTPRSRTIVVVNGFLMVLTFFIFRIAAMPIYWYKIIMVIRAESALTLGHIRHTVLILGFCLDSLNLYWFYKMCKGFVKAIKNKFQQEACNSENKSKIS
ncbi:TLC domain-containing protein 4-B-like [Ruditapes philippinarum]|uniref:TLC domain-containing protein 4-B-like n=1 Tax=Ruditapes philippinarum TaxID=129788 RepID=UPI00295AF1CD|nr:TLC domain-containing protein 4-B-like [Ruditapes philippinarum]